jgi:ABC-2 type transport system ATP-binding protein
MNQTAIKTQDLTRYFGRRAVVDHLSIEIPRGCICGFLGRNGAGKTTTIKMLLGLLRPTAGTAQVLGCDAAGLSPAIRQRIGYVTEGHRLFRWMSIRRLERFQSAFLPEQWDRGFFAEMLDYFELSPRMKVKHLSNGQRAQVSLALTLAPRPELLIMDDPTLGLDAAIRRQFLEGMINLIMQEGRTVLFSSHILGDVERVCDRLLVLDRGVLRADCSLEQFRTSVMKIRTRFPAGLPTSLDLPGLLHVRQQGDDHECFCVGVSEAALAAWIRAANAEPYQVIPMSMEDQFIEFTEPVRQVPLSWRKEKSA